MRILLATMLALALGACVTAPEPLAPAARGSVGSYGAATLSWSPLEDQLAPAYTRTELLRQRAARMLDRRQISREQAIAVLVHTDRARAALDDARALRTPGPITQARAAMDAAQEILQ